jgi:hypothetical protein
MIKVTLDTTLSTNINGSHPILFEIKNMEKSKKLKIFTLESQAERLDKIDKGLYRKMKKIFFPDRSITTTNHSDLCLLVDHLESKRDYFLTLNQENFLRNASKLEGLNIRIRRPDQGFIDELNELIK